ncbi:microsomal glutathione S-transferase 1-like [Rhynchophorus ferrugineus]|uniref:microsomal glutathione S-transferase 1-like n=1 Tax=Rhynchophorus ferrugineus TaxID=354439 RepID=UPI003FCE0C62
MRSNCFASPEDCVSNNGKVKQSDSVERIRRAHLNDLENIPIFLLVSLGYLSTGPSYTLAIYLFRVYALGRFLHTIVYALVVIPEHARALSFSVGYFITIYMAVVTLISLF